MDSHADARWGVRVKWRGLWASPGNSRLCSSWHSSRRWRRWWRRRCPGRLGFLFLLAGYELDPRHLRPRPGRLALLGWAVTAVLAVGVVAALGSTGYIHDFVPVGLALTTTAPGTLLPILQDNHMLGGKFGAYVMAAGAVGDCCQ